MYRKQLLFWNGLTAVIILTTYGWVPLYSWITSRMQFTKIWNTWTAPRPSQRPIEPPTWNLVLRFYDKSKITYFYLTSERKLARVGFTKSVVVTLTFEEKEMSIIVWAVPSDSYTNLVWVLVVLQGRGQSDTRLPAAKSYRASKQNCHRWYVTTQQMLV